MDPSVGPLVCVFVRPVCLSICLYSYLPTYLPEIPQAYMVTLYSVPATIIFFGADSCAIGTPYEPVYSNKLLRHFTALSLLAQA